MSELNSNPLAIQTSALNKEFDGLVAVNGIDSGKGQRLTYKSKR